MKVETNFMLAQVLARFVLGTLAEAVIVLDQTGNVVETNQAALSRRFLGILSWFNPDGRNPAYGTFLDQLRANGRASLELLRSTSDGKASYFVLEGHAVDSWFVTLVRDGSETRALQDELHQLRRVESLGLATARITHDLNNVLTPILYLTRDLGSRVEHDERAATLVSEIEAATLRAAAMVRDVLAFARRRTPALEPVNLNSVISSMQPLIERLIDRGVTVSLSLDENVDPVRVDRARLEDSLLNLVANAKNAMPEGGRLTIATANVSVVPESSPEAQPAPYVALVVTDTGTGMSDEVRARALDDFFTTRGNLGGTGLGLASVRRFAQESNGLIKLTSQLGAGTSITIQLPRAERSTLASQAAQRPAESHRPSTKA